MVGDGIAPRAGCEAANCGVGQPGFRFGDLHGVWKLRDEVGQSRGQIPRARSVQHRCELGDLVPVPLPPRLERRR